MPALIKRIIRSLDLEDRLLIAASIFTAVSVFFPWISGEWSGGSPEDYSGFTFFQSLIGWAVFIFQLAIIGITLHQCIRPAHARQLILYGVRLVLSAQSIVLILAALSVLTRVTFESSRMNVRYGIYSAFIGGLICTFYALLKFQQLRKGSPADHFHHPEDTTVASDHLASHMAPPPPPIPIEPSEPEEYRTHS